MKISESQFRFTAERLKMPVSRIKAVAEVEGGNGFLESTGEPVILFEPHVFWRQLKAAGKDPVAILAAHPELSDILYEKWQRGKYGTATQQHARLARAVKIDRDAALQSASWGAFQIMGYHWKACGCKSLQEFVNMIYRGVDQHLELFATFLVTQGFDKSLREGRWADFAKGYNGAGYRENHYDEKLAAADRKFA